MLKSCAAAPCSLLSLVAESPLSLPFRTRALNSIALCPLLAQLPDFLPPLPFSRAFWISLILVLHRYSFPPLLSLHLLREVFRNFLFPRPRLPLCRSSQSFPGSLRFIPSYSLVVFFLFSLFLLRWSKHLTLFVVVSLPLFFCPASLDCVGSLAESEFYQWIISQKGHQERTAQVSNNPFLSLLSSRRNSFCFWARQTSTFPNCVFFSAFPPRSVSSIDPYFFGCLSLPPRRL